MNFSFSDILYTRKQAYMKTITYLYISLFAFILFFFITIFIVNGNPIFFDESIRNLVSSWHADDFFKGITHFGNVYYILILILIGFLIFHKKSNFKFLMSMMLINTAANVLLKLFFARPRPNYPRLIEESGYSFPSGHAMGGLMFYGLLIYFLWQSKFSKTLKVIGTIILTLLIFLIGISRIYLGVHYPSDILGGFLASSFLLCFGIFFYQNMQKKER